MSTSGFAVQKSSGAENGLIGIKLYDAGLKVIKLYGTPDEIQAISFGSSQQSGGGPGGGAPGFGGGPGGAGGPRGGGGGGPVAPSADWSSDSSSDPFGFGNDMLRQQPPGIPGGPNKGGRGQGGPSAGGPSGPGAPSGPPSPGGKGGGGGAPGAGGAVAERVQYTRWVYNRAGSKYGFIIDKMGNVIQIEAIGLSNPKVKTKRGVSFGTNFATIFKKYNNPDGYEIAGDNIMVKYLTRQKVAFRLSRLGPGKKPHVVTGIVISAGKA